MPIFESETSFKPKIGDSVILDFSKWNEGQLYLLDKDGQTVWLSFTLTKNERVAFLRELLKDWLK